MRKMGEHLFFKLRPTSPRYHGHFYDAKKVTEQLRHFGIEARLTFGKCAVQIEYDQFFIVASRFPTRSPCRTAETYRFPPPPATETGRLSGRDKSRRRARSGPRL